jgi:hypothetical protein
MIDLRLSTGVVLAVGAMVVSTPVVVGGAHSPGRTDKEQVGRDHGSLTASGSQLERRRAGGQKNCTGNGKVTVTVWVKVRAGFHASVQGGGPPPTAPTWGRVLEPFNPPGISDATVRWAMRSSIASGTWGADVVNHDPLNPLPESSAQCSGRDAPPGTPDESVSAGSKDCPAGQTVIINSDGWGTHWASWRNDPGEALQRSAQLGAGYIVASFFVDTGMNHIVNAVVKSYGSPDRTEDPVVDAGLLCSDDNPHPE